MTTYLAPKSRNHRPQNGRRSDDETNEPATQINAAGGNVVEVGKNEATEGGLSRHWDGGYRDCYYGQLTSSTATLGMEPRRIVIILFMGWPVTVSDSVHERSMTHIWWHMDLSYSASSDSVEKPLKETFNVTLFGSVLLQCFGPTYLNQYDIGHP
ncbi:hypothetical protein BDN72DRAFT_860875 [Pluteus cervinus]|uniref:Uncharacterized protein n=1 Tax=Pluteus cervinus TaxID=181527 RepID=A0ACD3AHE0_9AGAR|nr:hypothetical protein BDN72DRAFT_860875 [Pluteus cervinus]